MRVRIIAATVVLSLGIVGITMAQHKGEQPKDQAGERAKLRARVVKLRVDIELLELEHDVDRDDLLACMKNMKQAEFMGSGQSGAMGMMGIEMLGMRAYMGGAEAGRAVVEVHNEIAMAVEKREDTGAAEKKATKKAVKEQARHATGPETMS
jgi:hypothetical protein